jgi:LPS-assembly lipoprotein
MLKMLSNITKISCKNSIFAACIAMLTLASVGCGFHLRGNITVPPELKILKITPDNPNEPLQRNLRHIFTDAGITIVAPTAKNVAHLDVSEPTFSEQVLTIGLNNQPQRIKLELTFTYVLSDKNDTVLQNNGEIKASRDFSVDPNNILSANAERDIIKSELYQDAINSLMRRITKEYITE